MKFSIIGVLLCCAATSYAAPRIVGGYDAPDGKYPYQVSIWSISDKDHKCGGSIIDKSWIVTAAHCLMTSENDYVIIVGTNSLEKNCSSSKKIYKVRRFFVHPDFQPSVNDIGLIQLEEDIEFNSKVQPIKLSQGRFEKINYPAVATGWGRTEDGYSDKLQKIDLKIMSNEDCEAIWSFDRSLPRIWNSRICTFTNYGRGICDGDSGGPLVADGELVGITSFSFQPCGAGAPDVFTRVSSFISWIKETIENNV